MGKWKRVYVGLAVVIAYAGLACITTWPLVTQMGTHLSGNSRDVLLHYWNGWWVQRALASSQSPFYTPYLFYPHGVSLATQNIAWFQVLPWSLLKPLAGGIAAFNLALLINLTLCGCAAFWLTRTLTADSRAAFLAGLIYQAWPFRLSQLDHPNLLSTQWIPLFFLFLISTIRRGRWRDALLAGLFFALIGYTRWQQLIPAAIMTLIYLLWAAPSWFPRNRRGVLARLLLAGILSAIALLPPSLLLLGQQGGEDSSGSLLHEEEQDTMMQTDVLAYLTPAGTHPVLGGLTQGLYDGYYSDRTALRRYPAYVGLVALFLALIGLMLKRWEGLPWALMAVIMILLALGPSLRFNGQLYEDVPTLYRALSPLVIVRLMRVPDRFNMFLALPVSVLAAYGAAGLLARRRRRPRWQAGLLSSLLAGLILFEYLAVPVPLRNVSSVLPFYAQLAQEPGNFAVLNLPFDPDTSKAYMFDQISHGRPIVQGHVSRFPSGTYAYIDGNPWLSALRWGNEVLPELSDVSRQLGTLAQDDIRYVIIHKAEVKEERLARWQRYLLAQPRYEDERIVVYTTSPEAGRDFELLEELVPGLGPIEVQVLADDLNPGRVLELDVGWGSRRALDRDLQLAISLVGRTGAAHPIAQSPLSAIWPTSEWPTHAVAWGHYNLLISHSVPAGEYAVTLSLLDSQTGRSQGKPMPMQEVALQSAECDPDTLSDAKGVNALFGDALRFLEYRVGREERRLSLMLYWRSEGRMDTDYKVFVHVFDPATGIPVAQDDAMPRRWAYPTTRWRASEAVEDCIPISLDGVPGGSYGIAIGVYEPVSGARLALTDGEGRSIADGRLVLAETVELK